MAQKTEKLLTDDELFRDFEENCEIGTEIDDFHEDLDDICDENEAAESDEEDYFYDSEDEWRIYKNDKQTVSEMANTQNATNRIQPAEKRFEKFRNRINVEKYSGPYLNATVSNNLIESEKKLDNARIRIKDKQDRATSELVLDARTRLIIYKMLNKGLFDEVNGCVSTGKEANVYHAINEEGKEFALKVYKTSILIFKDRDKYVTGEFRFRNGYSKKNPRKMVQTWAEKEMRNLCRLQANAIKAPEPILLRLHVLLMSFIGKNGWAAPKLKDVELTQEKARELYWDVVVIMWKLHNKCRLVHADLSEYNMLYLDEEIYIIDVSQSVEHDHKNSFHFLRKDIANVTNFFRKKGVATMTIKDLFFFIVDPSINEKNMEEVLLALSEKCAQHCELTAEEQIDEQVFMEVTIAKTLSEIKDVEKEIQRLSKKENPDTSHYKTVVGLKDDLTVIDKPLILQDSLENKASKDLEKKMQGTHGEAIQENSKPTTQNSKIINRNPGVPIAQQESDGDLGSSKDSNSEDSASEDDEEGGTRFVNSSRPKHESLDEKKTRKKAVKEAQAEKRKDKLKKHLKKRKVKANKKK